jgi:hypothetical protein
MPERDCYPGVIGFFNACLVPRFKPRLGCQAFWTVDTSLLSGDDESVWARPDVTSIIVSRGKYAAQSELTLIGGEVKLKGGADLKAVHQTLAQSLYTHLAYLVCEADDRTRRATYTNEISVQCERLGLGFATFLDPNVVATFEIHVDAKRHEPAVDDLDYFIETRIDEYHQDQIRACLAPDWGYE